MVTREGTRPLLIEVQALVDECHGGNPRRVTLGLEQNRLAMLFAVLHRHGGVAMYDQDVFVNVVGGMRLTRRRRSGGAAGSAVQLSRPALAERSGGVRGSRSGRGNSSGAEWRGAVAGSGEARFQTGHCAARQFTPERQSRGGAGSARRDPVERGDGGTFRMQDGSICHGLCGERLILGYHVIKIASINGWQVSMFTGSLLKARSDIFS